MLNRIIIMGRLTRDPELRRTQTGTAVTSFTLAVDRDFKSKETGETACDFIDCVAWRNTAEFVNNYFTKGRMAIVEGKLQIRPWKDKDGNSRRSAEVIVDQMYFGDSKRDGAAPAGNYGNNNGYGAGGYSAPAGNGYAAPAQGGYGVPTAAPSEFSEIDDVDGELPF